MTAANTDIKALLDCGKRILAIDLGRKRVGLAISDPLGSFALGLETLQRTQKTDLPAEIGAVCSKKNIGAIVLGLPVNMDGTEGKKAEESRQLAAILEEKLALPVMLIDERLTSKLAEQQLIAEGFKPSRDKGKVDQRSAEIILNDFFKQQQN